MDKERAQGRLEPRGRQPEQPRLGRLVLQHAQARRRVAHNHLSVAQRRPGRRLAPDQIQIQGRLADRRRALGGAAVPRINLCEPAAGAPRSNFIGPPSNSRGVFALQGRPLACHALFAGTRYLSVTGAARRNDCLYCRDASIHARGNVNSAPAQPKGRLACCWFADRTGARHCRRPIGLSFQRACDRGSAPEAVQRAPQPAFSRVGDRIVVPPRTRSLRTQLACRSAVNEGSVPHPGAARRRGGRPCPHRQGAAAGRRPRRRSQGPARRARRPRDRNLP